MSGRTGGDSTEFQEAMADATPIAGREQIARPKTIRRRRRATESDDAPGVRFEIERIGERTEGIAQGVDRALLRKLRNRDYPIDARVDLHGFDAAAARRRVRDTVERMQGAGRCLLVIHGRGRGSESGPVLKEALVEWLGEAPLASRVLAFASAQGRDGGVGATYVLLRKDP